MRYFRDKKGSKTKFKSTRNNKKNKDPFQPIISHGNWHKFSLPKFIEKFFLEQLIIDKSSSIREYSKINCNYKVTIYCKRIERQIYTKILFENTDIQPSEYEGIKGYSLYIYDVNNGTLLGPNNGTEFADRPILDIQLDLIPEFFDLIKMLKIPNSCGYNEYQSLFDYVIKLMRDKYVKNPIWKDGRNKFVSTDDLYFYYFLALMPNEIVKRIKFFL